MSVNTANHHDEYDVFSESTTGIVTDNTGYEKDPDFYKPSLKNERVKEKVYDSLIRFVPNIFAKEDGLSVHEAHKIHKYLYYLGDPNDAQSNGFYVDCPSTVGKDTPEAKNNIITSAHFMFKNSDSAYLRNIARTAFSRKEFFWSLVLILSDEFEPETVGKIKIFRFGQKINEKIESLAKGNVKYKEPPLNVYHPVNGRDMILMIEEQNAEMNGVKKTITTYENSKFAGSSSPISIDGGKTRCQDPEKIKEFLKTAPRLSKVRFQPWDSELETKVIEQVRTLIDDDKLFNALYKKVYKSEFTGVTASSEGSGKENKSTGKSSPSSQEPTFTDVTTTDEEVNFNDVGGDDVGDDDVKFDDSNFSDDPTFDDLP